MRLKALYELFIIFAAEFCIVMSFFAITGIVRMNRNYKIVEEGDGLPYIVEAADSLTDKNGIETLYGPVPYLLDKKTLIKPVFI